jgi:hypothetical protein
MKKPGRDGTFGKWEHATKKWKTIAAQKYMSSW